MSEESKAKLLTPDFKHVMDDPHTQQTLDDLADLFLTGVGPNAPASNAGKPAPPKRRQRPLSRCQTSPGPTPPTCPDNPSPTENVITDYPLDGPAPIRLEPKPVAANAATEADDALELEVARSGPELRLCGHDDELQAQESGDYQAGAAETADRPAQAFVEAVLLGNLPGLAGPWLTQYAQMLAQQDGPVVICHVDDDRIDLELVEPTLQPTGFRGLPRTSSRRDDGGDLIARLDGLVRAEENPVGTVLLHVDVQTDRHGLARAMELDYWTLVCGADDTAIVGGYRMLKQLTEADPGVSSKHVGLMVMGSTEQVSRTAAGKLKSAAASFLRTPVELIGYQQQMIPVNLRYLGTSSQVQTLWPRLVAWLDRLEEPEPVAQPQPGPQPGAVDATVQELAHDGEMVATPEVVREDEVESAKPVSPPVPPSPPPAAPIVEQPEPPAPPKQAAEPASEVQPNLAELLVNANGALLGGVALEARCPGHQHIQLLLDRQGNLHLLCRHAPMTDTGDTGGTGGTGGNAASQDSGTDSLRQAVLELIEARNWVREHVQLLQLTLRQRKFDLNTEPVLHLFTDRADLAVELVKRLGKLLQLHLLQSVRIDAEAAWFCTALS